MGVPGRRRLWFKVHLYLGLIAGFAFVVLGLTGSVLVFSDEIDRALNPRLDTGGQVAAARRISPDEALASVEHAAGHGPYMLESPSYEGDHYLAFIREGAGNSGLRSMLVDAGTGQVLADRPWGKFFVSFARRLHTELLMGDAGNWVVGAIGVLTLISLLTGLYLWWPRGGAWRKALKFHWHRYSAAIHFELHRVAGFYLLLALLVITLSGTYLVVPQPFEASIGTFARLTPLHAEVASTPASPGTRPLSLVEVSRVVERHTHGATVTGFSIPQRPHEAFEAYYRDPAEPHSRFGRSILWIDQYSGRILHARRYASMGSADRFLALQILLHNGEIAGRGGRWLVFLSGIAIPLLFVTGIYVWWIKRRPRRRAA